MGIVDSSKQPKLSIVTVHYKDPLIFKTIESVFKTVKTPFEYILVDNKGDEKEWQELKKKFPQCAFIQNPKPFGYARGMNVGLKHARGKFLLPLNPDLHLLGGTVDKMIKYLEEDKNEEIALLGPKLLNADKSIQYSCRRYPSFFSMLFRRGPWKNLFKKQNASYEMHEFNHDEIKEVDWLCGGFLMMRKTLLQKIGYLDEFYFLYFDDVDFCRRAKKEGRVLYYPEAQAVHNASYESKTKLIPILIHIRSMLYYFLKYQFFSRWYLKKGEGWKRK
jgi:GT2 family glycosyltransferase